MRAAGQSFPRVRGLRINSGEVKMKSKTAVKKPNIFVRMGRKLKEVFSELKKVTWPSFGKVIKSTGVVIAVVVIFLVVFTAINYGLSALLNLISNLGA